MDTPAPQSWKSLPFLIAAPTLYRHFWYSCTHEEAPHLIGDLHDRLVCAGLPDKIEWVETATFVWYTPVDVKFRRANIEL